MIAAKNIKSTPLSTDSVIEYMKFVKKCFQTANKSLAVTLMDTLATMKYDGSRIMHHISCSC